MPALLSILGVRLNPTCKGLLARAGREPEEMSGDWRMGNEVCPVGRCLILTCLGSLYLGAMQGFRCCSACPSKASGKSYWPELAVERWLSPRSLLALHVYTYT